MFGTVQSGKKKRVYAVEVGGCGRRTRERIEGQRPQSRYMLVSKPSNVNSKDRCLPGRHHHAPGNVLTKHSTTIQPWPHIESCRTSSRSGALLIHSAARRIVLCRRSSGYLFPTGSCTTQDGVGRTAASRGPWRETIPPTNLKNPRYLLTKA